MLVHGMAQVARQQAPPHRKRKVGEIRTSPGEVDVATWRGNSASQWRQPRTVLREARRASGAIPLFATTRPRAVWSRSTALRRSDLLIGQFGADECTGATCRVEVALRNQ